MVIRGSPPQRPPRGEVKLWKLLFAAGSLRRPADLGENVFFLDDEELFAIDRNLVAGILAEQDAIPNLYVHGNPRALVVKAASTHSHDISLIRLLSCGVRD